METATRLASRAEIQDVMLRYARGVDRRDWVSFRRCFHDDATDRHGDFDGHIDAFVDWVSAMHAQVPFSAHFMGNSLIEFADADTAAVETYFNAMLRLSATSEEHRKMLLGDGATADEVDMDVIGRYLDRFERRDGEWRIARREVAFDCVRARAAAGGAIKPEWVAGQRDKSDPVYELRRAVGLPPTE